MKIKMFSWRYIHFKVGLHGTMLLYFRQGLFHSISPLACKVMMTQSYLQLDNCHKKLEFWDDAFFAVLGVEVHPDYVHVHMCRHN